MYKNVHIICINVVVIVCKWFVSFYSCTINSIMFNDVVIGLCILLFDCSRFVRSDFFFIVVIIIFVHIGKNRNELQLLRHVKMGALNVFDMFMSTLTYTLYNESIRFNEMYYQEMGRKVKDNYAYRFQFRSFSSTQSKCEGLIC